MSIGKDDNNNIVFGCDHKSCETVFYTADHLQSASTQFKQEGWYRFPTKGHNRLHRYEQLCPLHGKTRVFLEMRKRVSERMICSEVAA